MEVLQAPIGRLKIGHHKVVDNDGEILEPRQAQLLELVVLLGLFVPQDVRLLLEAQIEANLKVHVTHALA